MATFGRDYDVLRWSPSYGEEGRDEENRFIWHERLPDNDEWERLRTVTVEFLNPETGERTGIVRNYPVHPDVPLAVYGSGGYDLDDLVQFQLDIGSPPLSAFG